jgi:hypothetical protein
MLQNGIARTDILASTAFHTTGKIRYIDLAVLDLVDIRWASIDACCRSRAEIEIDLDESIILFPSLDLRHKAPFPLVHPQVDSRPVDMLR